MRLASNERAWALLVSVVLLAAGSVPARAADNPAPPKKEAAKPAAAKPAAPKPAAPAAKQPAAGGPTIAPTVEETAADEARKEKALNVAMTWFPNKDRGLCYEAWRAASGPFRAQVPTERWIKNCEAMKEQLGELRQRTPTSATPVEAVPGVPNKKGYIFTFRSAWEKLPLTIEIVGVVEEQPDLWGVGFYKVDGVPGQEAGTPPAQVPSMAELNRTDVMIEKAPWVLKVGAPGFQLTARRLRPDGTAGAFEYKSAGSPLHVMVLVEPAIPCKDATSCRDFMWEKAGPKIPNPKDVKLGMVGEYGTLEFIIPEAQGKKVEQRNMNAHIVRDGFWVDVHLAKDNYVPADRELFLAFLKTLSFEKKP